MISFTSIHFIPAGITRSVFAATPTTFSWEEPIQWTRQAHHRFDPPNRPGRRTTSAVFSPKTDPFPVTASPLLLTWSATPMRCFTANCPNMSHKLFVCSGFHRSNLLNLLQCLPQGDPGPLCQQFPPTTIFCDSCRFPIRRGTRPLACDFPDCRAQAHAREMVMPPTPRNGGRTSSDQALTTPQPDNRYCTGGKLTIAISFRDAATAALRGGS